MRPIFDLCPEDFNYLTSYLFECALRHGPFDYHRHRLFRILKRMFDSKEKLSDSQMLLYDKLIDKMFEL